MPSQAIGARGPSAPSTMSRIEQLKYQYPPLLLYLDDLRRRGCSERTIETYGDCLGRLVRWLEGEDTKQASLGLLAVNAATLDRFIVELAVGDKPVGIGRRGTYITVMRGFYRYCVKRGLLLGNPAEHLRAPKRPKRLHRDILTPTELGRLLHQPGNDPVGLRDQVALRLLALSGLRAGEAAGVLVTDLELSTRELIIRGGKGGHERMVFIDASTQGVVARYLVSARPTLDQAGGIGTLLLDDQGKPMRQFQLRQIVKRYGRDARINKPLTSHSLRRTFCTLMLESRVAGMNLKVIAELAGHAKLRTTARYTQVSFDALQAVYHQAHPCAASPPPELVGPIRRPA